MDVKIEVIQKGDEEQVIEFLKERFFKDEPLNASLDLGECPELELFCLDGLDAGYSFKALNEDGELIGVAINCIVQRDHEEDISVFEGHEKFYRIIQISDYANKQVDLFGKNPKIDQYLEAKVLSVSEEYRCKGVAKQLIDRKIKLMEELNIPVFYCQCSSNFAAKAVEKMGFTEAFSMPYSDFLVDGKQILNPPPPHDVIKIFLKWNDKFQK